jgi:hypothetical protein
MSQLSSFLESRSSVIEPKSRRGKLSLAIRILAAINAVLTICCLVIGKHDLNIPRETPLALTIPFWVAPTSLFLVLATLYRAFVPRERAKGAVLKDSCFTITSIVLLVVLDLTMAGL